MIVNGMKSRIWKEEAVDCCRNTHSARLSRGNQKYDLEKAFPERIL